MADIAAHLVDNVLPPAQYRQWTLSLPWQIRTLLLRHRALTSSLLRIFLRQIFAWQRHVAKPCAGIASAELAS